MEKIPSFAEPHHTANGCKLRPRWFEWPNVLSVDAAVVAVVWQLLLARAIGVPLPRAATVVLGLSVWIAYIGDRLLDVWQLGDAQAQTPRHRFFQKHFGVSLAVAALALAVNVSYALSHLPPVVIAEGLLLTGLVGTYLWSAQRRKGRSPLPKEACTGVVFAVGIFFFPIAQADSGLLQADSSQILGMFCGVFGLVFANCVLVGIWEEQTDRAQCSSSFAQGSKRARVYAYAILGVGALAALWLAPMYFAQAVVLSSGLLVAVDLAESRLPNRYLRILADLAVLTPPLAWWLF